MPGPSLSQTDLGDLTGVFRASLKKRSGFFTWLWLFFWTAVVFAGLSTMAFDWAGLGVEGRKSGLMVASIASLFVIYLLLKIKRAPGLRGLGFRTVGPGRIEVMRIRPGRKGGNRSTAINLADKRQPIFI